MPLVLASFAIGTGLRRSGPDLTDAGVAENRIRENGPARREPRRRRNARKSTTSQPTMRPLIHAGLSCRPFRSRGKVPVPARPRKELGLHRCWSLRPPAASRGNHHHSRRRILDVGGRLAIIDPTDVWDSAFVCSTLGRTPGACHGYGLVADTTGIARDIPEPGSLTCPQAPANRLASPGSMAAWETTRD